MYIFTIPREKFDERAPDKRIIRQLISKHISLVGNLKKNMAYYQGKHKILEDAKRENRLVCNHAKDISDTASSYFIGNPVTYKSDADIKDLTDSLETAGADETDGDNGLDLSIYGLAYEYVYVKENENNLLTKNLSPENTFMVKDDSIEENELFAVYYYVRKDDSGTGPEHYIATVLTPNYKYELDIQNNEVPQLTTELPVPHYLGEIPIIEYLNNKLAIGDFELQIPLIDAYNALMSDRITDKEQFIDAILAIYGTLLSDEDEPGTEEEDQNIKKAKERLKKYKVLEMPDTAKAEYLTRTFDESGVEILKKAIEQDIHKFSHIPCMSDESFGGNVSGVAMEFKLLGMENITKIKTRYYRKGLRKRIRIFCNYLALHGKSVDPAGITMTFTRALPKNLLEISQIVANLWGKVSRKTLLSQVPFVDDVDEELKALDEETEENLKRQQEVFGMQENTPPQDGNPDQKEPDKSEKDDAE
ncbi:phage portal protein [Ruminococcus sp. 1001136sp1]|uniref:phage portal protein n=1 Tax=unclassified Ruminococcus TaxID=2608920 RepID=UPI00189F5737|nr:MULTISPECIES: phage portal protein [unclassified Ruminococcus]MDB8771809.1 phage portal protein [Ruminococcus sp. 1001136sp1]MDB8783026.1 phage portal protein [Ruminococcus sp. 1001136sp1]